nr:zinc finger domain-containing protein [Candidatus Korarchaeum cryptofilum]
MDREVFCTSCGRKVTYERGIVAFKCPNCGEAIIVRCSICRKQANEYVCPNCGFTGP